MTNADVIRSFNNEQLAAVLTTFYLKEPTIFDYDDAKIQMIELLEDEAENVEY